MPLEIKVIAYKDQQPDQPLSAFFGQEGGDIGKNVDNALVLPDPNNIVSRKHAVVSYENNNYLLKDTSGNGTYICNKDMVLHHNTMKLSDGDELKIGDYTLNVSIINNHEAENLKSHLSPMNQEDLFSAFDIDESAISDVDTDSEMIYNGSPIDEPITPPERMPTSFNFQDLLKDSDDRTTTSLDAKEEIDRGQQSGVAKFDAMRVKIPEDQHLEDVEFDTMRTETPEAERPDRELFDIFLESAGVLDRNFFSEAEIPDIMRNAGAIFGKMVEGLMKILEGRAEQKKEIRADMTIIRRTENNPLKQLPALEEAVIQLIANSRPGFLKGVDAVQEGCADIMEHHLAMTSGLQVSLKKLLKKFDPQHFEEKHKNGIALSRKIKCWDGYSQSYPQMIKELFDNIYGEAFVKAYDSQVRKLRKELNK